VGDGTPESTAFRLSGDKLVVRSDLGPVELVPVEPSAGPEHEIRVTRWFAAARTAGDAHAEWVKEGTDTIRLSGVCSGVVLECRLRHRVEVPSDLAVEVRAADGSVAARGFSAPLDIRVSGGNINVEDASGRLRLTTREGSMRAERLRSERVEARAQDGYVILEFDRSPVAVESRSARGNTTIRLPEAGYRIRTDLTRAKATIKVDRDADAEHRIDAAVTEGRLRIERS